MTKTSHIRRYFVAGLLIWVPLVITVWVLNLLVGTLDQILQLLPPQFRTENWLGVHVPGFGVAMTVLIVFVTGVLAANIIGQRLVAEMKPQWLRIGGYWYPRGGMPIDVFWQSGEPPAGLWLPDQGVQPYRGRG